MATWKSYLLERMASVWMKVARYADSDGYQLDQIGSK